MPLQGLFNEGFLPVDEFQDEHTTVESMLRNSLEGTNLVILNNVLHQKVGWHQGVEQLYESLCTVSEWDELSLGERL